MFTDVSGFLEMHLTLKFPVMLLSFLNLAGDLSTFSFREETDKPTVMCHVIWKLRIGFHTYIQNIEVSE